MEENLDDFIEAGKIAARIREDSKKLIIIGETLLEIAENIESMIENEGVMQAFPVNIGINDIAAHYTPELGCEAVLSENDVVKIDLGVAVGEALSDTAYTIDLNGKNESLLRAAEDALETVLKEIKAGAEVGELGGIIEERIKSYGFKPISNLTGHMIKSGELHGGISFPNVKTPPQYKLKEGDIFAVEPFATNGRGYIEDTEQVEIFSLFAPHPIRMRQSRQILQHIIDNYQMRPFAERWIRKKFPSKMLVNAALKEMLSAQVIRGYPVLKEENGSLVSQFEHTILIEEKGVKILTK